MNIDKHYRIGQTADRNDPKKDHFNWEIWLEDGDKPIAEIEKVEYLLHPTYPNRLRSSSDADTNFKIKGSGWGEFMIRVIVYEKSGEIIYMNHWLTLRDNYSDVEVNPKEKEPVKTVYLSYANADAKLAEHIESKLNDLGVKVNSPSSIPPQVTFEKHINDAIASSDAIIVITPDHEDPWQQQEMKIAQEASKQTISIKNFVKGSSSVLKNQEKSFDDLLSGQDIKSIAENIKKL